MREKWWGHNWHSNYHQTVADRAKRYIERFYSIVHTAGMNRHAFNSPTICFQWSYGKSWWAFDCCESQLTHTPLNSKIGDLKTYPLTYGHTIADGVTLLTDRRCEVIVVANSPKYSVYSYYNLPAKNLSSTSAALVPQFMCFSCRWTIATRTVSVRLSSCLWQNWTAQRPQEIEPRNLVHQSASLSTY